MKKQFQKPFFVKVLDAVPGKSTLGLYRFLPFYFLLGAALEFSMINWTVGETNFYKTYKKRQALNLLEHKAQSEADSTQ